MSDEEFREAVRTWLRAKRCQMLDVPTFIGEPAGEDAFINWFMKTVNEVMDVAEGEQP